MISVDVFTLCPSKSASSPVFFAADSDAFPRLLRRPTRPTIPATIAPATVAVNAMFSNDMLPAAEVAVPVIYPNAVDNPPLAIVSAPVFVATPTMAYARAPSKPTVKPILMFQPLVASVTLLICFMMFVSTFRKPLMVFALRME